MIVFNWNLVYASDRGKLQTRLVKAIETNNVLKAKLQKAFTTHPDCEAKNIEYAQLLAKLGRLWKTPLMLLAPSSNKTLA